MKLKLKVEDVMAVLPGNDIFILISQVVYITCTCTDEYTRTRKIQDWCICTIETSQSVFTDL